jgi:hypothetical protein
MTKLLYWLIYNIDLGPLGPVTMDLAVRNWLRFNCPRAVPKRPADWAPTLHRITR